MKTEYTISQIAEKLHITTNKIRFYEKKGLLTPMRESQNRYRKFGEEDIFRLETILLYRSLGLSIEAIQNILQCNKKENYLTHMQNQWMAVNNEIHRLSEIRKSLEMVLDKVYEETEGQDLEKDFLKIIEQSNLLCQVKNEWKDQWDFDGWARAYDEDVKGDTGALKIYENYETVLQMVFEFLQLLDLTEQLDMKLRIVPMPQFISRNRKPQLVLPVPEHVSLHLHLSGSIRNQVMLVLIHSACPPRYLTTTICGVQTKYE